MKTRRKMHKNFNRKYCEWILLSFIILIIIFSCILQFTEFLSIISIKAENIENLFNTLFTVQASVATISIAIIALITGFSTESIYGLSTMNFIIEKRPHIYIFKYEIIIVSNLILIILNFFSLSFLFHKISTAIFIISILLSIKMVLDITGIYKGKQTLNIEIEDYVLNYYSEEYLKDLYDETLTAIESNNSLTVDRNVDMMRRLFEKELNSAKQDNKKNVMEQFFIDVYLKIFSVWNHSKLIKILDTIVLLYETANSVSESPIPLKIWDKIEKQYYETLAEFSYDELTRHIITYHNRLFENINVGPHEKQTNCRGFAIYASHIYDMITNNKILDGEHKQSIKKKLFDNLTYYLINNQNDYRKLLLQEELCRYIRNLIDNNETDLLQNIFHYIEYNETCFSVIIICAQIYLYYLAEKEPSIAGNPQQKYALDIIQNNKRNTECFMARFNYWSLSSNELSFLRSQLMEQAKSIIVYFFIEDFLIFASLINNANDEQLYALIKQITHKSPYSLCKRHFGADIDLKKMISGFCSLFFNYDIEAGNIERYKIILYRICKEAIIKYDIDQYATEEDFQKLLMNIEKRAEKEIETLSNNFPEISANIISEEKKHLRTITFSTNLGENYCFEYIQKMIAEIFLNTICKNLKEQKIESNSTCKQDTLINIIKDFEADTVIGQRDIFWEEANPEQFKEYTKNMQRISWPLGNTRLCILKHNLLYFQMMNLHMEMKDLSENEILESAQMDEQGRVLYMIDDISIPFEKNEWITYIRRTKKKLLVYADIEYAFACDTIGCDIAIPFNII